MFRVCKTVALVVLPFLFAGCEDPIDLYTTAQDAGVSTTSAAGVTSTSAASSDGVDLSGARVQGAFDFRNAVVTAQSTGVQISGASVSLSWNPHPVWGGSDGICDGVVCAIWQEGGGWTGAYFDYAPQNATGYSWGLGHIVDGYGGPGSGAQVGFFIMARDCTERSTIQFTTWP